MDLAFYNFSEHKELWKNAALIETCPSANAVFSHELATMTEGWWNDDFIIYFDDEDTMKKTSPKIATLLEKYLIDYELQKV